MNVLTLDQLKAIMPKSGPKAALYVGPLNAAMARFDITTPARVRAFLAQIAHESGQLQFVVENLNYSDVGLSRTWPSRFAMRDGQNRPLAGKPNALAVQIARKPELIANHVYSSRLGNGNFASGDGWKYRGRGLIQLTGRSNYTAAAESTGRPYVENPDLVALPEDAALTAAWFWETNNLNRFADKGDFDGVSDAINLGRKTATIGDSIGYDDRLAYYRRAQAVIV